MIPYQPKTSLQTTSVFDHTEFASRDNQYDLFNLDQKTTPIRFRAAIGANARRVHILDLESVKDGLRLSMCNKTAICGIVSGQIVFSVFCQKCLECVQKCLPEGETITHETLGCREII